MFSLVNLDREFLYPAYASKEEEEEDEDDEIEEEEEEEEQTGPTDAQTTKTVNVSDSTTTHPTSCHELPVFEEYMPKSNQPDDRLSEAGSSDREEEEEEAQHSQNEILPDERELLSQLLARYNNSKQAGKEKKKVGQGEGKKRQAGRNPDSEEGEDRSPKKTETRVKKDTGAGRSSSPNVLIR